MNSKVSEGKGRTRRKREEEEDPKHPPRDV
jgi:hypothetical protein